MTNPVHVKLADTAKRLIAKNGATVVLVKEDTTGPDYDPVVTRTTQSLIAVRTSFSAMEVGDGSRIKSTDIKYLMDSETNPLDFEKIEDGNKELQIIDAVAVHPGDISIIYKVQARL